MVSLAAPASWTDEALSAFWSKVEFGPGCWVWRGCRSRQGYGLFWHPILKRSVRAHRAAWELENGPVPDGQCVLHRCDNRPCVRERDLFLGTHAENNADMTRKGRQRSLRGEMHGSARLSDEQVSAIRTALAARSKTYVQLAAEYGIDDSHVYRIRSRRQRNSTGQEGGA